MAEELDRACMHCGEILSGPNAGEFVPPADTMMKLPPGQQYLEHKGRKISHCGGHGCKEEEASDARFWAEYAATHPRKKKDGRRTGTVIQGERFIPAMYDPNPRTIGPSAPREGKRGRKPTLLPPIDPMKETLP